MKNILIVGGERSDLTRSLIVPLRDAVRPAFVECYFGHAGIDRHLACGSMNLPDAPLLLLALSADSQNKESALFEVELRVLKAALRHGVRIGVISDKSGKVTAPHLQEIVNDIVIVVTQSSNTQCELGEQYPNATICSSKGEKPDPHAIAETIAKLVPRQRMIGERVGVARSHDHDKIGWERSEMTE